VAAVLEFPRWGASPADWAHWDLVLGLGRDLLPVVSNPKATINPTSTLKTLGKTPSRYNAQRQVGGIKDWTSAQSTPAELEAWSKVPDYGICLQTRAVRALDVDVPDPEEAVAIRAFIEARHRLPARVRATSSKFLLLFRCEGTFGKTTIRTAHGIIERLATGNQCVVAGAHIDKDGISRSRYEWDGGLPEEIPTLARHEMEALLFDLEAEFGVAQRSDSSASLRTGKLSDAITNDPVAKWLMDQSKVLRAERDGRLHIECPWKEDHTTEGETSTTYFPANTGGYARGHFECLHAHCQDRKDEEFRDALGYVEPDPFEDLTRAAPSEASPAQTSSPTPAAQGRARFASTPIHELRDRPLADYHIKGVLPRAGLAVIYGEPGSGKSFIAWDMALAVAQGAQWRGKRTKQGRVVYVVAEGREGLPARIRAYEQHFGVDISSIPFRCVERDVPSLMQPSQTVELCKRITEEGGADLVVIDTLSQVMSGGDENSSDMTVVVKHCDAIHRATGATVVLVHHSGKDPSKGARGHSSLKGAVDAEFEVLKAGSERSICATKVKDGPSDVAFGFTLTVVELGKDEDGDPITSCVCTHNDAGKVAKRSEVRGAVEKVVWDIACTTQQLVGGAFELDSLISDAVAQLVHDPLEGKRDTRRQRVLRAVEALQRTKHLAINDGKVLRV